MNAFIHRNYLELGSEVHIDMYDDRLEIYSPGGLMNCGSIKDMDVMNIASRRRNPGDLWFCYEQERKLYEGNIVL